MKTFLGTLRHVFVFQQRKLSTSTATFTAKSTSGDLAGDIQFLSNKKMKKGMTVTCPFCGIYFEESSLLELHLRRRHTGPLNNLLRKNPVETYTQIFGKNYKRLTDNELRYKDGLVITLQGQDQGLWYSFTEEVGGGPLKAISHAHGFNLIQSLEVAANLAGLSPEDMKNLSEPSGEVHNKKEEIERRLVERERNISTAINMWNVSVPLTGTLAERYLHMHRGIPLETVGRLEARFLPDTAMFDDAVRGRRTSLTSLIVKVVDPVGSITGVQRIFLDSEGRKSNLVLKSKKSLGVLKLRSAIVQVGKKGGTVVLAEGVETSASIASVLGPDVTVLASLSVSLMQFAGPTVMAYEPEKVILAVDNDQNERAQSQSLRAYNKLRLFFNKKNVHFKIAVPFLCPDDEAEDDALNEMEDESRNVDFNDILVEKGPEELLRQLQQ